MKHRLKRAKRPASQRTPDLRHTGAEKRSRVGQQDPRYTGENKRARAQVNILLFSSLSQGCLL